MKRIFILIAFVISGLSGFLLSLYHHREKPETILETHHYPVLFVEQLEGDPRAGEKIFKTFCAACHAPHPIIEMNAPRLDNKIAWGAFKKMGKDTLLRMTIEGKGAMPARGGCFECSDAQLEEAISYMLEEVHSYPGSASGSPALKIKGAE